MATLNGLTTDTLGTGGAHAVISAAETAVSLPAGFNAAEAAYARTGQDLILAEPDGDTVVVRDFFAGDAPPDLMFNDGNARIDGDLAARLAGPMAPGQYAQAAATAIGEPIGQVESIGGTVTATRTDGTQAQLDVGDPVYEGDIVESASDGGIGIIFADETSFSLGPSGRMVLDEMVYDPGTQDGSFAISILQGVFTFVSGQVAKTSPDAMVLETPVATIGIRGTQGGGTVDSQGGAANGPSLDYYHLIQPGLVFRSRHFVPIKSTQTATFTPGLRNQML